MATTTPGATLRTSESRSFGAPVLLMGLGVTVGLAVASPTIAALAAVVVGGLLASIDDVRHRAIPNPVVVGLLAAAVIVGVTEMAAGSPRWSSIAAGAALGGGTLLVLHLISPEGMGFGDVKLAAGFGALLGALHWPLTLTMLLVASSLGSMAALAVARWRRGMPFGLFLSLGALVAVGLGRWTLDGLL